MPTITLRGLPDHVHEALRTAADDAHRSLNSELLHRLETSIDPSPPRPDPPGAVGLPDGWQPPSPEGWHPQPPRGAHQVREPAPAWGREVVDATTTPLVLALSGETFDLERRSAMIVGSEPVDGWLHLEWHWVRVEGEEALPSGAARLSIDGLAQAELGGDAVFGREEVKALVADLALDALAGSRADDFPLRRINRFGLTPPATLLLLRIDPATRGQLEAVRDRTRLTSLRNHLDRLLGIGVEILDFEESAREDV